MITLPDRPINLADNAVVTHKTQIALTWEDGLEDGGSEVIDYRIWYAVLPGDYQVLVTGVTDKSYIATALVTGTTYSFKVQSRNYVFYSDYSDVVSILAAQRPE